MWIKWQPLCLPWRNQILKPFGRQNWPWNQSSRMQEVFLHLSKSSKVEAFRYVLHDPIYVWFIYWYIYHPINGQVKPRLGQKRLVIQSHSTILSHYKMKRISSIFIQVTYWYQVSTQCIFYNYSFTHSWLTHYSLTAQCCPTRCRCHSSQASPRTLRQVWPNNQGTH